MVGYIFNCNSLTLVGNNSELISTLKVFSIDCLPPLAIFVGTGDDSAEKLEIEEGSDGCNENFLFVSK